MYQDKYILCVIPARGGSKGIPGKNIKLLGGIPLIGYAIRAAKASKYIDRVVVSTDNDEIAEVAKTFGAEVPFMRPSELATDDAPVELALQHAVTTMKEKENFNPDTHVLIQPTSPFVKDVDIDAAIETFFSTGTNSCVSMCEINDRPEKMYSLKESIAKPFFDMPPMRRQDRQLLYLINGAVYVTKIDVLMLQGRVFDNASCSAIIMPRERSIDVDTQADFDIAETLLNKPNK